MALFGNIVNKVKEAKLDVTNKLDFRKKLLEICSDGKITDSELSLINELAARYNIEEEDFNKVKIEAYKTAFKAVLGDGILTEEERQNIYEVQQVLQVSDAEIPNEVAILNIHNQLREIQFGRLPVISNSGLILKSGEIAHFIINADLLEERVISRNYQGGSSGVNFRVAKGVSFRVGQQKGRMVSKTGIVAVDNGDFIITNQRMMFKGRKKSFNYSFNKLIGYTVFSDGLDINSEDGKTRSLSIKQPYNADVLELMINYLVNT